MSKDKRYTITLDAYLYARNDREAMVKAVQFVESLNEAEDNQAKVLELSETPFATLSSRLIHKGKLTLFENKLKFKI